MIIFHDLRMTGHCRSSCRHVNGASTRNATVQRQNVRATGGASKRSARPITKLPAQQKTAAARIAYAETFDACFAEEGTVMDGRISRMRVGRSALRPDSRHARGASDE